MCAGKGQEAVGSRCLVMPGTWIWRGRQGTPRACPWAAARRAHHPVPMWPQHRPGDGALAAHHTCSTLRAPGGLVSEPQATDPFPCSPFHRSSFVCIQPVACSQACSESSADLLWDPQDAVSCVFNLHADNAHWDLPDNRHVHVSLVQQPHFGRQQPPFGLVMSGPHYILFHHLLLHFGCWAITD